jgi:murein DD-endopeptidase MepM/ murein hydrolase activator NlpD
VTLGWLGNRWIVLLGLGLAPLAAPATPLPDEWPGAAPTAVLTSPVPISPPPPPLPTPAPAPAPAARPERPALVPVEVAVGDLTPPGQRLPRAAAGAQAWLHPLPIEALEVSPWGWRWSQARGAWRMHTGVDLIVPAGTPVLAARAGRVVLAESVSGYGLTVLLDHGDGWQTLYAHLERMAVAPGQPVGRGERLGSVGATGSASTPHLHLELRQRRDGVVQALNPTLLLQAPRPAAAELAAEGWR